MILAMIIIMIMKFAHNFCSDKWYLHKSWGATLTVFSKVWMLCSNLSFWLESHIYGKHMNWSTPQCKRSAAYNISCALFTFSTFISPNRDMEPIDYMVNLWLFCSSCGTLNLCHILIIGPIAIIPFSHWYFFMCILDKKIFCNMLTQRSFYA